MKGVEREQEDRGRERERRRLYRSTSGKKGSPTDGCLEDDTLVLLLSSSGSLSSSSNLGSQSLPGSSLEDITNSLSGSSGALDVSTSTDLLSNGLSLSLSDGPLAGLLQLLDGSGILSEILLATDKDDGEVGAEVKDLRDPLLLDVIKRIRRVDREAD